MTLHEINDAANLIHNVVKPDANIIIGTAKDENLQNAIQITVIATGFEERLSIETPKMSAAEYFSGSSTGSAPSSTDGINFPKMPSLSFDLPDFMKKD